MAAAEMRAEDGLKTCPAVGRMTRRSVPSEAVWFPFFPVERLGTMSTTTAAARRQVRYGTLDEIVADAERLARGKFHTLGAWTYPQILDHVARAMAASLDGFGFKSPWVARFLIAPFVKNSILYKGMKPGFKLPKSAVRLLPAPDIDLETALDGLRKAVARWKTEPQRAPHPFFGKLAEQEHTALHLRHAELHMSFVVPESA